MRDPDRVFLGDLFKNRRQRGSTGLPLMSVTQKGGLANRSTLDRKTDSDLSSEEHLLIKAGDIAYNTMRMWQGAFGLASRDGVVSPAYVVLEPTNRIDPQFAAYWFKSSRMLQLFRSFSYGLTDDRLRLYYKDFAKIPVTVPPLAVQKRLGRSLEKIDNIINRTGAALSLGRLLRTSIVRDLSCAPGRRPPHEGGTYQAAIGSLPRGWKSVRLSDLALINASSVPENTDPNKAFYYLDVSAVAQGRISRPAKLTRFQDAPSRARRLFSKGDILMSTVRPTLQGFGYVECSAGDCVCSTGFAVLHPRDPADGLFLYAMLYSPIVARQIHSLVSGSGFPAISCSDTGNLNIPFSSSGDERKRIGATARAAERQVLLLEKLLDLYLELRLHLIEASMVHESGKRGDRL